MAQIFHLQGISVAPLPIPENPSNLIIAGFVVKRLPCVIMLSITLYSILEASVIRT